MYYYTCDEHPFNFGNTFGIQNKTILKYIKLNIAKTFKQTLINGLKWQKNIFCNRVCC